MIDAIRHRGPDASGIFLDREAGLAHARLTILDPVGGRQPMTLPGSHLCITYNGEVFNYVELKDEMLADGVRFSTTSDTEVVLQRFRLRGPDCVHDCNGQWAFAVWDAQKRELFLSRDRAGIVPLYYTVVDGTFVFASEIKAILQHPAVSCRIDLKALDQVFTFWHPINGRTLFQGIRALPPGCNLRFRNGRVSIERYWSFDFPAGNVRGSVADLAGRLRELLIDATRIRLRADVPVGAYLSGGLDSTTVAALVKRYTDTPLRTFSVTFDDSEFDESTYQRRASDHLGTRHTAVACPGRRIGQMFPEVVWHAEVPVVRTAPAPLFALSQLVRDDGYKVVLTGEGADEVLGGYDIFKEAKIRRFWGAVPDSRFRPLLLEKLYPYMKNMQKVSPAYRQRFFRVDSEALASPFFSHLPRWEMTRGLKVFFSDGVRAELDGYDAREELMESLPGDYATWPAFCQGQYLEATGLLPGYILSSQGDRMLMGHSVEGRFPFLDHRVIEFAAGLAVQMKMRGLNEKFILKRAVSDLVPPEVLARPKQPYRAPDAVSFQSGGPADGPPDYVREMLDRQCVEQYGLFNADAVAKLAGKARRGKMGSLRDNMAFVAVLSTQLVVHQFMEHRGIDRSGMIEGG